MPARFNNGNGCYLCDTCGAWLFTGHLDGRRYYDNKDVHREGIQDFGDKIYCSPACAFPKEFVNG